MKIWTAKGKTDAQKKAEVDKKQKEFVAWWAANCGQKDQEEEALLEDEKVEMKEKYVSKLHPDVKAGKLTAWMLKEIKKQNVANLSPAEKKTFGKQPLACQKFHLWAMSKYA